MNILIIPPNDLINNEIPNRLYHLARHWQHHTLYLLRYPHYPTSTNIERPLRRIDIVPDAKQAGNPATYYLKNARAVHQALKRTLQREPIDVVIHANILPSLYAVRLAKAYGKRAVFDYLDHYPESAAAYFKNRVTKWAVYTAVALITTYNLKNSHTVVTVSHTLKQLLERRVKKPIHLIPNGVDTELFKPMPKEQARRQLALEEYSPILLYYGSITEWIDYKALLWLTARLKTKYPNILLLLIGKIYKKSEEEEIKATIKQLGIERNVKIIPTQPQEKIPAYIAAADIVYAPFKNLQMNYGTPVKIFEAMACERPVVATELEEFKKWFKNYLLYYTDYTSLEEKTRDILENYDAYMSIAANARTYAQQFDWKNLAKTYETLLATT